jgi:DNA invertase Pin-like site-specific DNA recombinase
MTIAGKKAVRCAIYTRKSTERGLELEFNSLQAQREACMAYIKSQASEGWRVLPHHYDDAAYSGGSLDRPALQRLLKDISDGEIDVVVVYKIDRLTRSLTDFAKLVEQFEARAVSFVAVTQQFNTTTSMGRLTLNVLLSFAQFERELASERVRDKVAASRKKGKWTGGSVPLGYDVMDKKLVINVKEAKTVRYIFQRYLQLKSFRSLIADLDSKGIHTKKRILSNGKTIGGARFTYGPLSYLLKNRTYLGETSHGDEWFPGEHEPILDQPLFQRVRDQLAEHSIARTVKRSEQDSLLTGFLFDDRGNRMSPSFTTKNGVRYRFYVSAALLRGRPNEAGSAPRAPAPRIEKAISDEIVKRKILGGNNIKRSALLEVIEKIIVSDSRIQISLKRNSQRRTSHLELPWASQNCANRIEEPRLSSDNKNNLLIQSVARAHLWLEMLENRKYKSIEALAKKIKLHPKVIREMIQLAFLSPEITTQILIGSQPAYLNLKALKRCRHLSWAKQNEEVSKLLAA